MAQSGYTICPQCGDVTVSSDTNKPELCSLCEELGDPDYDPFGPDADAYPDDEDFA